MARAILYNKRKPLVELEIEKNQGNADLSCYR